MQRLSTVIYLSFLLLGCTQPKPAEITTVPEPVVAKKISKPEIPKEIPKEVVILVSEDVPAYSQVAQAVAKNLGQRGSVHYLKKSQFDNLKMLAAYKDDKNKQFVSIGLNASVTAKSLEDSQVIFCQVFNYQDYDLLSERHKGVSMVPISRTFATWRALSPGITDIGVISGPGLDEMIHAAKTVAEKHGITLHYKTVNSDKEYQFAYKGMADEVQGFWLLPDNRVLSSSMLSEVMTYSVRNGKQVAVFNDELLNLGGLFSVTSDPQDVAQQVLDRLEQSDKKDIIPGDNIGYLDKAVVRINSVMAQRLNLNIPKQFNKYKNAP